MTEQFIKKARLVHGDRYDYSKVYYTNCGTKVIIICEKHGEFLQIPGNHLYSTGCSKCAGTCKSNTEEFIEKSIAIHGDKYDYMETIYKNNTTKVNIICPKYGHGVFQQTPKSHLKGAGCGLCAGKAKMTLIQFLDKCKEKFGDIYDYTGVNYTTIHNTITITCKKHGLISITAKYHLNGVGCTQCTNMLNGIKRKTPLVVFIKKCREKHGDSYDYSKVDYKRNNNNVTIICQEHGEFQQTPDSHLNSKGCPKCSGHYTLTTEEFIENAKLIHGDLYGYSKVDYSNTGSIVIISCKKHGEFQQNAHSHIRKGTGCPKCANKNITTEEFIEKAKLIHGDLYDYSIVDYKQSKENVSIVCNIHGEFLQKPNYHLSGSGCPKCSNCCYSKPSILWLDFLSKLYNINIQHASNDGEYVITTTKYKADGYCKENNTIYEFHGDYWHGNPKVFNPDDINEITKCTYKDLYDKTLIRENKIKELGYNLITIWENDWKKLNKCIKILQQKFRNYN